MAGGFLEDPLGDPQAIQEGSAGNPLGYPKGILRDSQGLPDELRILGLQQRPANKRAQFAQAGPVGPATQLAQLTAAVRSTIDHPKDNIGAMDNIGHRQAELKSE